MLLVANTIMISGNLIVNDTYSKGFCMILCCDNVGN